MSYKKIHKELINKGFKKYEIVDGEKDLTAPYLHLNSFNGGGLVFDSSILFIKFHNYSKVHFNKKSFRIVKSKIEMIDVDFIKVDKTD